MLTELEFLNARADVVSEILTGRHEGHEQLALAINRARNAVLAGHSAHAAIQRGEQWMRAAEQLGRTRTSLAELICAIPGTRAHNVHATATGYRADLTDYHTGRRLVIRIDETGG